ncbi:adenosylcobinamide-GDP ribazoletransferase [Thermoactinomyces mirandus]|uniref:Adenosylcobinamide-GDP ribazoletransferase n=1 Tax=Thermoactinomyces mirandus TaxID=2756294 RepID=A0A7W2AQP0_9BACL|nr:adenosylcobinamide-GDP ribazoletransferase [Thermoactinomyces mirandus]MBA4601492.1 adenosylcobinamide-GDP ribazoletransferase [Thermoactinomyces mirandus]
MNSFIQALTFMTRIPLPARLEKQGFDESPMWYPLVGIILGTILFLFDAAVAAWFPSPVEPLLILSAWVFLTGGLHLDGWMDTADGMGSNRDSDKIKEIMTDSRVGAMGVLAVVLLLMLKAGALIVLADTSDPYFAIVLILACVWGRMGAVVGIRFFPYAKMDGLGKGMRQHLNWKRFGWALVCTILPTVIWLGFAGLIVGLFVLVGTGWIGRKATKTIGGCTGDIYGAMIEAGELVWLLFFTIPEVQALCV